MPNGVVVSDSRFALETCQHGGLAPGRAGNMLFGRVRTHALVAQQHHHVQKAVAQRLAAQRRHPGLGLARKQLRVAVKRIEIFAR